MANEQRTHLSSAFDELLAQNKKRFEDLNVRGRLKGSDRPSIAPPARVPAIELAPDSAAARRLKQMFGDEWRYEVAAQERHGDEAIVLCKLFFGKAGAVRTQFGRAKVPQKAVLGASDSIRFKMGDDASGERDALMRAAEAALMNCIALI